jgi:hypothetical protein
MASLSKKIFKLLDRIGSLSTFIQVLTTIGLPTVLFLLGKLANLDSKTLAIIVLIFSLITPISLYANFVFFKRRTGHSKSDKAENVANLESFRNTPTRNIRSENIGVPVMEKVGIRQSGGISNFTKTKIGGKDVGVDLKGGKFNSDDMDIH